MCLYQVSNRKRINFKWWQQQQEQVTQNLVYTQTENLTREKIKQVAAN
jgi:hypothetical protein